MASMSVHISMSAGSTSQGKRITISTSTSPLVVSVSVHHATVAAFRSLKSGSSKTDLLGTPSITGVSMSLLCVGGQLVRWACHPGYVLEWPTAAEDNGKGRLDQVCGKEEAYYSGEPSCDADLH